VRPTRLERATLCLEGKSTLFTGVAACCSQARSTPLFAARFVCSLPLAASGNAL